MKLEPNEFEMEHQVTYYECDPPGFVTTGMLINMAVLVSAKQSDSLQVGTDFVNDNGGGWVITNYEINVNDLPRIDEVVVLGTRATSYNRYFAFREFWVRDQSGHEYAHIAGMFVFMDFASRKMAKIPASIIDPYHSTEVKRIQRIANPDAIEADEAVDSNQYRVRYYDIDSNHHVNNSHYFDWMLDVLGADFLKTHTLKKMNIKYAREIRYGQMVDSFATVPQTDSQDTELMTKHEIKVDNVLTTQANCWWIKRSQN
ncbi:acyl-ACP thioesterase [Paucilactobacillus hokkaidonensis JCM 18461]|uniref:Acyl-ACP thioesterase n=3 Tax=Paucilactobacillus hokkaidonensis TaxID=1193095 RepID=A0A0A1H0K9_9LACO|nr:acyl-ACP thioesterase domain-containing protein [Paucilactobacillus hokkaidonensis]KRO10215.1 oleoyl-[acyl-carrier protein] thioesterase [Paucilactobacillus hokkaidonensis]BAP86231.1 acyl-ACP thioesterase [Paucilactobacillus hokkaidonensis JCM 18461]